MEVKEISNGMEIMFKNEISMSNKFGIRKRLSAKYRPRIARTTRKFFAGEKQKSVQFV